MEFIKYCSRGCRLALVALPFTVGCGGGESPTASTDTSNKEASQPAAQAAAAPTSSQMKIVQDGASTPAAETVAIFLDSLRRGNETAANGVLTAKAREELSKTSYVIQPLGTPEGQFKIGRVSFADDMKDAALVECLWQEPAAAGEQPVAMDIVCEVRNESEGWRISGIAVSIPDTEETLVLDFEDAVALQQTIDQATGQSQPPAGQQTAAPTGQQATVGLPQNSPLQPQGLPQQPQLQQPQQPTGGNVQIALPQLPGAPINR
ncbi:MAG: hypothetical protein Aurels2KO_35950 [Aureliella sp.]